MIYHQVDLGGIFHRLSSLFRTVGWKMEVKWVCRDVQVQRFYDGKFIRMQIKLMGRQF